MKITDSPGQMIAGIVGLVIAGGLLLGELFVGSYNPTKIHLGIGAAVAVLSLGLLSPMGFKQVMRQLRKTWDEYKGGDSG